MADDFAMDVTRWVKKAGDRAEAFKIAFPEKLVTRLKELTPVVTGRMRAGWHAQKEGEDAVDIVNDAEYAHRVNSGFIGKDSLGREYHQRGAHMVEQTIQESSEIAKETLEELP